MNEVKSHYVQIFEELVKRRKLVILGCLKGEDWEADFDSMPGRLWNVSLGRR